MKIAILLPYKENFSKYETGAVSIFVNSINKLSKYKDDINIFGATNFKPLSKNYENLKQGFSHMLKLMIDIYFNTQLRVGF